MEPFCQVITEFQNSRLQDYLGPLLLTRKFENYYDLFHGAYLKNDATRPQWVKCHWLLIVSERNVFFLEIYEYTVHDICYFLTGKNALSNYHLAIAKLSVWYDAMLWIGYSDILFAAWNTHYTQICSYSHKPWLRFVTDWICFNIRTPAATQDKISILTIETWFQFL